jgi:hypothetical protein
LADEKEREKKEKAKDHHSHMAEIWEYEQFKKRNLEESSEDKEKPANVRPRLGF